MSIPLSSTFQRIALPRLAKLLHTERSGCGTVGPGPPRSVWAMSSGPQEVYLKPVLSDKLEKLLRHFFCRYDLDGSGNINSPQELRQLCTNLVCKMKICVPETKQTIQRLSLEQGLGSHKAFNFDEFVLFWITEVMQKFNGDPEDSESEDDDFGCGDWWAEYRMVTTPVKPEPSNAGRNKSKGQSEKQLLHKLRQKNKEGEEALQRFQSGQTEAQDIDLINTAHRVNITNTEIEREIAKNKAITEELCGMSAARSGDVSARNDMKHEDILMSPAHKSANLRTSSGIDNSKESKSREPDLNTGEKKDSPSCCVKCTIC